MCDGPRRLSHRQIVQHDVHEIDEKGIARQLLQFLNWVAETRGMPHVSLDINFLDTAADHPFASVTSVRKAHLVKKMLRNNGLIKSLDLVELHFFR